MSGAGIREVNTGTSYEGACSNRKPSGPRTCTGGRINPIRNPVLEARLVQGTCNNNVHIIMEHLG